MDRLSPTDVAKKLADLYDKPFGGKPDGRYRISPKILRMIAGRRKLPESFIRNLSYELFELGFVLVDMETFYAIANARTFASYRRLGEASLEGTKEIAPTTH
jgi:hypothetical protein